MIAAVGRYRSTLALCALLAPLLVAGSANAQRRDFVGRVTSISEQSISVKDRRANIMTFHRAENTKVEGASWESIEQGDKVLVRWNLVSGIARHVVVLEGPPKAAER